MMRILLLLSLFLAAPAFAQDAEVAFVNDELCDQRLREVVNGMGAQVEISQEQWSEVVQSCAGGDIVLDISYQALLMMFGPQMIDALTIANAFTSAILDYQSAIDETEAERIADMYPQFQHFINGFNYVFLTIFIVLVCGRLFVVAFSAQNADKRKSHLKEAIKKEGVTWLSSSMLLVPAGGVLSVIQYLFATGLVFIVMVSKFLATLFYIGNGGLSLMSVVQNEVSDELATVMQSTVSYNMCGFEARDNVIKNIQTAKGYTGSELLEDDYVKCLTDVTWTPFSQTNLQTERDAIQGGLTTVDNPINNKSTKATYDVGINAKLSACASEYAEDYEQVNQPDSCGSVVLQTPPTSLEKATAYKGVLQDVFLSKDLQQSTAILAAVFYEQACRSKPVGIGAPCYRLDVTDRDLPVNTWEDRTGSLRFEEVPYGEGVLTEITFKRVRQAQLQAIRSYLSANLPAVASARLASVDSGVDVASTLGIEEDIKKIRRQINKGIWMSGVAFTNQFGQQLNTALLSEAASTSYSTDLSITSYAIDMVADIVTGSENAASTVMGIFPSVTLFSDVDQCWLNPTYCTQVALNPFGAIVENGVSIFEKSVLILTSNVILKRVMMNGAGISAFWGVSGAIKVYAMIYLCIGLMFTIVLPLMAMFTLLSKLLVWLKDAAMVMFSITVNVAISPLMVEEQKMIAAPIADAFKSLYVLSAHLLFISVGVIVSFLLLSFLMALNVVLFGILFYVFNLSGLGNFIDSMVYSVIRDLVIVGLLFFEVKYAISLINKVPEALAQHYELEFGREEPIFDKFINIIQNKVAPQMFGIFSGRG